METIFVQIASFRDPECQWTIRDLYDKARFPDRIYVGICWQYDEIADKACFEIETRPNQIRIKSFPWQESRGACWARHEAQGLWQGETYFLSIDSHMRFVAGWDEILINQLAECPSAKPVLSHFPSAYIPPNTYDQNPLPSIVRANYFEPDGAMRMRSCILSRFPPNPLNAAFIAPGFMFAKSTIIKEVPWDPYLYFTQEELSLAVRLYTHGFDVYSPKRVIAYHYYNHASAPDKRFLLHWSNCPQWRQLNALASQRLNHLLGETLSKEASVTAELEIYGLGTERSLSDFEVYSGIVFKYRSVHNKALRCGFIENLSSYLDSKVFVPELDSVTLPQEVAVYPENVLAPSLIMTGVPSENARIDTETPPGILYIHDFLPVNICNIIRAYAETQPYQVGGVVDLVKRGNATVLDGTRHATYIAIDSLVAEILSIFNDIWCNRVATYFNVDLESYERPQLLRYPVGGKYLQHSDSDNWMVEKKQWERILDRDYSVILYLNDDFECGNLEFTRQNYSITPKPGTLLAFPSDHRYIHAVLPTVCGVRYALSSWASVMGSPRIYDKATYAAIYIRQRRLRAIDDKAQEI